MLHWLRHTFITEGGREGHGPVIEKFLGVSQRVPGGRVRTLGIKPLSPDSVRYIYLGSQSKFEEDTCLGCRRSWVQIPPPRPFFPITSLSYQLLSGVLRVLSRALRKRSSHRSHAEIPANHRHILGISSEAGQ